MSTDTPPTDAETETRAPTKPPQCGHSLIASLRRLSVAMRALFVWFVAQVIPVALWVACASILFDRKS